MLKNIDPLLTPELLHVLALMGHGDEIAVVDANFPANSVARATCHGRAVTLAGTPMPRVVKAICSVFPLDQYVGTPVRAMAAPEESTPPVQKEVEDIIEDLVGHQLPLGTLDRFAFYEASRNSYAVVLTGEERLYGNVLLRKGVVPPEA